MSLKDAFVDHAAKSGDSTDYEDMFKNAMGFIMLGYLIQNVIRWSIGYDMLRKPDNYEETVSKSKKASDSSKNKDKKKTLDRDNDKKVIMKGDQNLLMLKLKNIINPALISSLVAISIASVPSLKAIFYDKSGSAPLYNYTYYPLYLFGSTFKGLMSVQLGCNFAIILDDGLKDQKEECDTTDYWLNLILKNVAYPFLSLLIVLLLINLGLMHDKVQSLIVMIQIASPSANGLAILTNLHKFLEKENAKCFLMQYAT